MEIILKRSGGIISIRKEAVKKVDWSQEELDELLAVVKREEEPQTRSRDATGYSLEINDKVIPIDLDKIPAKYKSVFESLKSKLKPVKF